MPIDLNITRSVDRLCQGKLMNPTEQKVLGIVVRAILKNEGVAPERDANNRPICPKCGKALNIKMKDGKHIYEYCKICGQHINWGEE